MNASEGFSYRPARSGEAEIIFNIPRASITGLGRHCYTDEQIKNWMGTRTPAYYEELISNGRIHVCELDRLIVGFVDAVSGEVCRLFLLPEVAGKGVGRRLLEIGIIQARLNHKGPIRVESTLNAEGFYARFGFRKIKESLFSHGTGKIPIEVVIMELE